MKYDLLIIQYIKAIKEFNQKKKVQIHLLNIFLNLRLYYNFLYIF